MKKYTTVVFDMDGTVLNTLDDLTISMNVALKKFDMPIKTSEDIRKRLGNGNLKLVELCVPNGCENPNFENVFEAFKEHYSVHCNDNTRPYDGVLDLMKDLKSKGYKMAIVSNKYDEAVDDLNKKYFSDYVSVAIGDREGARKKPAPDLVQLALSMLDSEKKDSVYIGDSEVDILTAKNSELDCITVTWGFRDKEFLVQNGGVTFADTPAEITDIL